MKVVKPLYARVKLVLAPQNIVVFYDALQPVVRHGVQIFEKLRYVLYGQATVCKSVNGEYVVLLTHFIWVA